MLAAYLPCVVVEPSHSRAVPAKRRHRRRIAVVGGGPVAQARLVGGQPLQPAGDGPVHVGVLHTRRRVRSREQQRRKNDADEPAFRTATEIDMFSGRRNVGQRRCACSRAIAVPATAKHITFSRE